ncbi:hypothetical protein [Streptomyces sp. HB132]|uniref:hypothetical protein n=1 Tax=Streptomyces sp. HB132 TaxID=767388 RepID=UPI00195F5068|nr:hypothetical protein [Streptomyces sp. HB132]MBM7442693.1 hypothetical protein [Streptomyces sp. HB132]
MRADDAGALDRPAAGGAWSAMPEQLRSGSVRAACEEVALSQAGTAAPTIPFVLNGLRLLLSPVLRERFNAHTMNPI